MQRLQDGHVVVPVGHLSSANVQETQMPQLMATIQHLKDGVKGFTVSAAVKNIEGWEEALGKVDGPAAKAICSDLETLKTHLQADPVDKPKLKALLTKLGKETVAIAGTIKDDKSAHVKELGNAISALTHG
jgi:hypothetical protein